MDLMEPGRAECRDIAAGEAVEHELDAFVARRDKERRKTEGERVEEAAWAESSRRHRARQDAEERAERTVPPGPGGALEANPGGPDSETRGRGREAASHRRKDERVTEQPDTRWDREYRKTTQGCVDAAAEAAGKPSPLMLPASGVGAKELGIKRPILTKKATPDVETRED